MDNNNVINTAGSSHTGIQQILNVMGSLSLSLSHSLYILYLLLAIRIVAINIRTICFVISWLFDSSRVLW